MLVPVADTRDIWEIYLSPTWLPTLLVADELGVLVSVADEPGAAVVNLGGHGPFSRS
jgi:hypothetical protein